MMDEPQVQPSRAGEVPPDTETRPPSQVRRLIAFALDAVVVVAFHFFASGGNWAYTVVFFALYHTISVALWGRSFGKAALALTVRHDPVAEKQAIAEPDGSPGLAPYYGRRSAIWRRRSSDSASFTPWGTIAGAAGTTSSPARWSYRAREPFLQKPC